MLTVALCLLVIVVICISLWDTEEDNKAIVASLVTAALVVFGAVFPFEFPSSRQVEVERLEVTVVDGAVYFLQDGVWRDILKVDNIDQGKKLKVARFKAPPSPWYWSVSTIRATIPIRYSDD